MSCLLASLMTSGAKEKTSGVVEAEVMMTGGVDEEVATVTNAVAETVARGDMMTDAMGAGMPRHTMMTEITEESQAAAARATEAVMPLRRHRVQPSSWEASTAFVWSDGIPKKLFQQWAMWSLAR